METNSTTDCNGYANYKEFCGMLYPKTQTPDGVYWLDDELDFDALDEMIRELSSI